MTQYAMKKNLLRGFLVGSKNVEISILQYVDDTIFFGEASMENIKAIKAILRTFELASDLKINFAKSCFGAIGMSDRWKLEVVGCLNCSLLSIPFVYLGISIGANPRRYQMWDLILKKCERKLARWKQRYLSMGAFLWGESDSHTIGINLHSYLFLVFFQDPQEGDGQASKHPT